MNRALVNSVYRKIVPSDHFEVVKDNIASLGRSHEVLRFVLLYEYRKTAKA